MSVNVSLHMLRTRNDQIVLTLLHLSRLSRVQEYKSIRVQKYKSARVQEYKSTRVQEYKVKE